VLDGELVAWNGHVPSFPDVCRRVLNHDLFEDRRALLEELVVSGPGWAISETFEDGDALYGRLRARPRRRRREEAQRPLPVWPARLGQDEEPGLLRRDEERAAMQRTRKRPLVGLWR
jgi:hypothetical protein